MYYCYYSCLQVTKNKAFNPILFNSFILNLGTPIPFDDAHVEHCRFEFSPKCATGQTDNNLKIMPSIITVP